MTEQELREKIVEALEQGGKNFHESFHEELKKAFENGAKHFGSKDCKKKTIYDFYADALIEKGMIFVDERTVILPIRMSGKTLIQKAQYYDQMKHRAEVEEKTAREACGLVFSQEIDEEDWRSVIYEYKAKNKKYCNEVGITDDMLYNYLKEQVEKVLPKERENDK